MSVQSYLAKFILSNGEPLVVKFVFVTPKKSPLFISILQSFLFCSCLLTSIQRTLFLGILKILYVPSVNEDTVFENDGVILDCCYEVVVQNEIFRLPLKLSLL